MPARRAATEVMLTIAPPAGHDVGRVAGHLPGRLQVRGDQLVELRRLDVEQLGRAPGGDVVDQRVEAAERVARLGDRPRAFLVAEDVGDHGDGAAAGALDLGHGSLRGDRVSIEHGNACAVAGQQAGDRPAHRPRPTVASAATRDQRGAAAHPLRAQRTVDVDSHSG